jgi:peptide/nickel transport system permease protein
MVKKHKIALFYIAFIVLIAFLAPFIATENGIIPFSPTSVDIANGNFSNPSSIHLLGTDLVGRDVLSMFLHGSKNSVLVGIFTTLIATFLGLLFGFVSGYWGNNNIKINIYQLLVLILGVVYFTLLFSYTNHLFSYILCLGWLFILFFLKKLKSSIYLPLDSIIQFIMQIISATPKLFLIIILSFLFTPSIQFLVICLGIILSTQIAFITRAEIIKTKNLDYILVAESLGINEISVFKNHILPNIFPTVSVIIINVAIVAIIAESGFSYLGIGIAPDEMSWGKLLAESRNNMYAWWIWVPPFIALLGLLLSLNSLIVKKYK